MLNPKAWHLKQIDLFKSLSHEDIEYVGSCFNNKDFKKGSHISDVNRKDTIFLLKKGIIELYSVSENGKKTIIDILGSSSVFGSLPHLDSFVLEALVKKDCVLCHMNTKDFFKLISKYPDVSEKLLKSLYINSKKQQEWISSLASESVPQRLIRLIKTLSSEYINRQDISFTHEDLAQMIGSSRQTVTTLINTLAKEGKLEKQGKQYRLIS